jgi:DnaB helicase-like protein
MADKRDATYLSPAQQMAILGHAITDSKIYEAAAALGLEAKFFAYNANANHVWERMQEFYRRVKRHPSQQELADEVSFLDERMQAAQRKTIDEAIKAKDGIAFDSVLPGLKAMAVSRIIANQTPKVYSAYERGDLDKAVDAMDEIVTACRTIDGQGVSFTAHDSATWSEIERQGRDANKNRILMTGITYIDDVTDGIEPHDLTIVSSKTGVGKSQLLAEIARRIAGPPKNPTDPVRHPFLLALEAYAGEMQRRLKWPIICRAYRRKNPHAPNLDWVKFAHGRYQDILAPYEAEAHAEFAAKYSRLKALYRHSATFGIVEMEKAIVKAVPTSDVILLDHLHYVDTDTDAARNSNEYHQQKKIVQKLREISLTHGKPIIAAAHVTKLDIGKFAPLVPPQEKIMGTSDIQKIASMIIMMGPTSHLEPEQFDLQALPRPILQIGGEYVNYQTATPTFIQLTKSRIAGSARTTFVAVCYYDRDKGQYLPQYHLGHLRSYGTKWTPCYADEIPEWGIHAFKIERPTQSTEKGETK